MTITIDAVPPSQNRWLSMSWTQGSRMKRSRMVKEWKRKFHSYGYLWAAQTDLKAKRVRVTFFFPDRRRRDKQNWDYFKPIPDGLTEAGIIADDNNDECQFEWCFQEGTKQCKTVVELFFDRTDEGKGQAHRCTDKRRGTDQKNLAGLPEPNGNTAAPSLF